MNADRRRDENPRDDEGQRLVIDLRTPPGVLTRSDLRRLHEALDQELMIRQSLDHGPGRPRTPPRRPDDTSTQMLGTGRSPLARSQASRAERDLTAGGDPRRDPRDETPSGRGTSRRSGGEPAMERTAERERARTEHARVEQERARVEQERARVERELAELERAEREQAERDRSEHERAARRPIGRDHSADRRSDRDRSESPRTVLDRTMTQRFEPGWPPHGRPDRAPEPRPHRPPAAQRDGSTQGPSSGMLPIGRGRVRKVSPSAHSRTPLLVRTTIVVGLIAALAASVNRADQSPEQDDAGVTAGTAGGQLQDTAGVASQNQVTRPDQAASRSGRTGGGTAGQRGGQAGAGTSQGAGQTETGQTGTDVHTPAPCHVSYSVTPETEDRFMVVMVVSNTSEKRANGWTLRWAYPPTQKITYGWNALVTNGPDGAVATGIGQDRVIAPGGNVTVGFAGQRGSWVPTPTDFTLDGQACHSGQSGTAGENAADG